MSNNYDMIDDMSDFAQKRLDYARVGKIRSEWDEVKQVRVMHYTGEAILKRPSTRLESSMHILQICDFADKFLRSSYK